MFALAENVGFSSFGCSIVMEPIIAEVGGGIVEARDVEEKGF